MSATRVRLCFDFLGFGCLSFEFLDIGFSSCGIIGFFRVFRFWEVKFKLMAYNILFLEGREGSSSRDPSLPRYLHHFRYFQHICLWGFLRIFKMHIVLFEICILNFFLSNFRYKIS